MSAVLAYQVELHERPGGFLVTFPDFEDARTSGRDKDHALHEAVDCLREALAVRIRNGEDIPAPSQLQAGAQLVCAPAEIAAKVAVYEAFKRAKVSKSHLADQLHVDESEVRRILDPLHRTKLGRLEQAAEALGVRLQIVATQI